VISCATVDDTVKANAPTDAISKQRSFIETSPVTVDPSEHRRGLFQDRDDAAFA
jgi:hypothetical protein